MPFSQLVTAIFTQAPVLMMIGKEDEMPLISREVQLVVFDRLKCQKEFYEIDEGHFRDLYPQSPLFYEEISVKKLRLLSV